MRIIHISDIHIWRFVFNPFRLAGKRAVGMAELVATRSRKFRLERLDEVVGRIAALEPDHLLITGDLTTTSLPEEFEGAWIALARLLGDPSRVTVLPGNHDRYTMGAARRRLFEEWFGRFGPGGPFPWIRQLSHDTAILGLDPTRPHLWATGRLPGAQLERARGLVADAASRPRRLIVACHYPLEAPPSHARELWRKRLKNAGAVASWLGGVGRHLYCCGHVHAAWAHHPRGLPDQLCVNAGAPLLRDANGLRPPGFVELTLHDRDVSVAHHAWNGRDWEIRPLFQDPAFFPEARPISSLAADKAAASE